MPRYTLLLARNVSVYGTFEVEADTAHEAAEMVRHAAQNQYSKDVETVNAWDNVFEIEWGNAMEERICSIENDDTGEQENDGVDLTDPHDPWSIILPELRTALRALSLAELYALARAIQSEVSKRLTPRRLL